MLQPGQTEEEGMTAVTEEILLDRIKSGRLIEDSSQATERYIEGLKRT